MKKYGIFLAYPPTVDLRAEGLGRHLAEFLNGAQARGDVRFVIACPSWMQKNLIELFDASGVSHDSFEIIAPLSKPVLLRLHEAYVAFKKRTKRVGRLAKLLKLLVMVASNTSIFVIKKFVGTRSVVLMVVLGPAVLPILFIAAIFKAIKRFILLVWVLREKLVDQSRHKSSLINKVLGRMSDLALQPKQISLVAQLYRLMEESEASLMHSMIEARTDIGAWYSPTAFWPHFNEIQAPRLMCVPDVVLADFPVGFAPVGGQRVLDNFRQVEKAIEGGQHFVTYSEDVKWRTLVGRYHVDSEAIQVVTHGSNRLDDLVVVTGFPDNEAATDSLCRNLFRAALCKAVNNGYAGNFGSEDVRFIFYASQFRPNKNVITLLKAYEYLLKRLYVGHKLVLTGNPNTLPEIARFITEHNLENDVLCLHGLSAQELAACYRLADLAVNPSLSEGGCPFTFTEALSVGTPVVMARIPVTEEVITDPELQQQMLFDPYDWKEMADKIEWGLNNRCVLLAKQKPLYNQLSQRTWRHVVDEYVEILDSISLVKQG
jgi:glycosyltransferase involved in cell wall biosynthesis